MLRSLITAALIVALGSFAASADVQKPLGDEMAIRKALESYVDAFNHGDAAAAASHWSRAGEYIYYEGDQVYEAGKPVATADQYYQQASNIAASAPEVPQQDAEWLPLGVFALSRGDATDSNMLLQLAVNKDGVIAGTYYNTTTDTGRPVKGMVDKQTQRAAWTFADGKNTDIIMETGISNLTQDQTEALVHFGKDNTQKWLMVRLKEPQEDTQPGTKG